MQVRSRESRGVHAFTLVELMIVISVLAILAALVIPRLNFAEDDARLASVQHQLMTIRGQIERYRVQHDGADPDMSDWSDLVDGDYLPVEPVNPMNGRSNIGAAAAADVGWVWRPISGTNPTMQIYAVDVLGAEVDY